MKKIFIILLLIIISCVTLQPRYTFQKTYNVSDSTIVIKDIYIQLYKYGVDSIPLYMWITSEYSVDTNKYIQKIIRSLPDKGKEYDFIYTKFIYPYKTYYQFKIREVGKLTKF